MAQDRFIDYFEYADLDPAATREANYELLKRTHLELKDKHSKDAELAKDIVTRAMAVFKSQEAYDAYRARWAQRRPGPGAPRDQPAAGPPPAGPAPAGPAPAGRPAKGFKAALLEIGANALRSALENRAAVAGTGAGAAGHGAGAAGAGAGLTGTWRDNMGATLQVRQVGADVAITVMNGFGQVVSQGHGILTGTRIEYEARDAAGQSGRGVLMVSSDGHRIEGEITWYNGFGVPAGSGRVLLVRAG
jgi:hypothetical protein